MALSGRLQAKRKLDSIITSLDHILIHLFELSEFYADGYDQIYSQLLDLSEGIIILQDSIKEIGRLV